MKIKTCHTIRSTIRIFLMVFWLYVALDKLWNLQAFRLALFKQPFPAWWADVLYWLLPMIEIGIALAFLVPGRKTGNHSSRTNRFLNPYFLSALLMLCFTVYIGLGVAGVYAQRPCSCASVFNGMSWGRHLVVNMALLGISLWGWWWSGSAMRHRFPHRFAVFPGRPVQ